MDRMSEFRQTGHYGEWQSLESGDEIVEVRLMGYVAYQFFVAEERDELRLEATSQLKRMYTSLPQGGTFFRRVVGHLVAWLKEWNHCTGKERILHMSGTP